MNGAVLDTVLAESAIQKDFPFDLVVQKKDLVKIGSLKSELGKNIRRLDLAFNSLTSLWGLEQLPNLRVISAYTNNISDLNGLRGLTRLECLRLQQNCVLELVDCFTSMRKLKELRLDHNNLSRIDSYLSNCSSLQTLNLSSNRLVTAEGLAGLQSLQELKLSNNSIRSLLPLRALPFLKELDVSYNKLATLEGLQNLNVLETLHAEFNLITSIKISQTYSRGNKALAPATTAPLSASAASAAAAFKKAEAVPPLSANADVLLGMSSLMDVFLRGNKLKSLEGLGTLGLSIELLDVRDNCLNAGDISINHLFSCKKLTELHMSGNPVSVDSEFCGQLADHLLKQCASFKKFDDQVFVHSQGKGSDKGKKVKAPFRTWDDATSASSVSGAGTFVNDGSTIATFERDDQNDDIHDDEASELYFSENEKEDEEKDGDGYDFNAHNAGLNAPILSLKNLKTPEEIAQMEQSFKSLLGSCKETLFTILLQPDQPFVSKPVFVSSAQPSTIDKREQEERADSVEQAASLFHHSSLEVVSGFRDTIDHRGSLVKGSKLVIDDGGLDQAKQLNDASPPKSHVATAFTFQIKSNVAIDTKGLGIGASVSQLSPESQAELSEKSNSTVTSSKAPRSPLTESRRLAPSTERPLLGSGLTRHGTKIKQRANNGQQIRETDPLVEFLQAKKSQKILLDFAPVEEFPTSPSSQENAPIINYNNHKGGAAAFLTATHSDANLEPGASTLGNVLEDDSSFWVQHQYADVGNSYASSFGRFRPASKLGVAGIDTRFLTKDSATSNSARSLPDVELTDAHAVDFNRVIENIKCQRRFSEPLLMHHQNESAPANVEFCDDLEDDDRSSRTTLRDNRIESAKVLKAFKPKVNNSLAFEELEVKILAHRIKDDRC